MVGYQTYTASSHFRATWSASGCEIIISFPGPLQAKWRAMEGCKWITGKAMLADLIENNNNNNR